MKVQRLSFTQSKQEATTHVCCIIRPPASITTVARIQKYGRMHHVELQHDPCKPPYKPTAQALMVFFFFFFPKSYFAELENDGFF